jgi:prepilin-type N-terminal cleavage/methylation domain-containing protein
VNRRLRDSAGFTLVEVLVATSLLALVMLIVYNTLNGGVRHAADVQARIQIESDVRVASDTFVRDLRQAYSGDPTGTLTRVESGMTGTKITFYSPDRATPFHLRKISYRLNGTKLERSVTVSSDTDGYPWSFGTAGPWIPVVADVRNAVLFTYADQDGNATTDPTDLSTVTLALTVDRDTARQPGPLSYQTTVNLRGF